MSVDIDWDSLTTGPSGLELAEYIRHFIHDKFQQIALPRFIRSVEVHSFAFGAHPPTITLKDICDPLPEFYDSDFDDADDADSEHSSSSHAARTPIAYSASASRSPSPAIASVSYLTSATPPISIPIAIAVAGAAASSSLRTRRESQHRRRNIISAATVNVNVDGNGNGNGKGNANANANANAIFTDIPAFAARATATAMSSRPVIPPPPPPLSAGGSFARTSAPGIPGGTSNLSYFHLPLGAGLGGTGAATPLAAVSAAWAERRVGGEMGREAEIGMSMEAEGELSSRPSTARSRGNGEEWMARMEKDHNDYDESKTPKYRGGDADAEAATKHQHQRPKLDRDDTKDDLQIVLRVQYAGDVRLALTTEILLDYPMPSFVGIPLTLTITGLRFDGVALLAYLRHRAHFCFLGPEDAEVLIGAEDGREQEGDEAEADQQGVNWGRDDGRGDHRDQHQHQSQYQPQQNSHRYGGARNEQQARDEVLGGLLREIRIESEIGQKEGGKQVLKNVGKVEKFVLEQVRRIFEDEVVWPSYYTFLV